jgi:transcriptional regulator with XRE-family HTH domain
MGFNSVKVSDVKSTMGGLIKTMRTQRKLTQIELAEQLNLSRITIQNVERGNNFTIDTLLLLLQYFDELESFNKYLTSKVDDHTTIKSIY